MAQLLVVILHEPSQLSALLDAWHNIGVPGITILESAGGYRTKNWLQEMGLGALSKLFSSEAAQSKTLLTVIEDDEMLERAIVEAQRVIGDFFQPGSGLLFVVPVTRAIGIMTPKARKERETPLPEPLLLPEVITEIELVTRDTPVSVINEILKLKPVIVQSDQPLIEVARAMEQSPSVYVACVVNEQQRLVGLLPLQTLVDDLFMIVVPEEFLSEARDLEDALHFAQLSSTRTAGDAMIPAVWVKNEETLKQAFRKMHENQLSGIPIVNDRYEVTGYINLLELLAIYARSQKPSNS